MNLSYVDGDRWLEMYYNISSHTIPVIDSEDWSTMHSVKVSPKFQVVIPKKVRELMELKAGEELRVMFLEDSIRLVRPRTVDQLVGIAKGMKWKDSYRDRTDRY
jgi:AbrB family looped-hinge helix DNA binding protein